MRILAVTNMYPTAQFPGLGTFVEQQIKGLNEVGLDVNVMFLDRVQRGMRLYWGLGRNIQRRIHDCQPDLVHIMYGGIMADFVSRVINDRPIVVSFCGSDLLGEPLSGHLRRLIAGYGVLASHRAARRAHKIIVKSKNLRDALPSNIDRSKITIIPSGVDLERFKPLSQQACRHRLGWRTQDFNILFPTNSGNPTKRPQLAEAAIEILRCLGMQVEMHLLRGVAHEEVPIWLNACDVVLLTSLHEGSPNVIKEALACDVPVVSVDVGDVRKHIERIEGCYLALPEPNDLAAKLQAIYAGPRRVTSRAKMQELSLGRISLHLKELYCEVVTRYKTQDLPERVLGK
jgi:teichuronic acid biosynthesis glycosyltransferase TuaC